MAKGVYVGVNTVKSGTESRQTLRYGIGTRPGYVGIHIPTWDEISQKYVFSESDNPIRMGPNNTWYNIWTEDHEYKCAIIDGNPNIFYGLTTNGFEDEHGFYEERVPKARKVNKIYIGVQGLARKITKGYIGGPGDVVNATLTADEMAAKVILDDGSVNSGTVSETRPQYSKPGDFTWFYAIAGNTVSNQDAWGSWIEGGIGDDFVFAKLDDEMHYYYERVSVNGEYQFKEYTRGSVARQFWPAITLDPIFANNSWANIIYACQNKIVPDTWAVGNQKTMTIGGTDYAIDIIGKNHDTYSDGSGTAPLTFQTHECMNLTQQMKNTNTNANGWSGSRMRGQGLLGVLQVMPTEVQSGIHEVNKLTSAGNRSTTINTTADKLFLLSEIEIFGSTIFSVSGEGMQYAYYKAGNSKTKHKEGNAYPWWERSPNRQDAISFCLISDSGGATYNPAAGSYGVSFAFCF